MFGKSQVNSWLIKLRIRHWGNLMKTYGIAFKIICCAFSLQIATQLPAVAAESKEAILTRITGQLESESRPDEAGLKVLESELDKIIAANPSAAAYHLRAMIKFYLNDYGASLNDCNAAIKLDSRYSKAYMQRGVDYCLNGKPELGVADFTKAIECGDKRLSTYLNRGSAEQQINKHTEAIADFTKVIAGDKNLETVLLARMLRSRSYLALKKYELAAKDADLVIEGKTSGLPPEAKAEVYKTKGSAMFFLEKYQEAIDALKLSAALSTGDAKGSTTFILAASYAKLGDKEKAMESLKISKKLGYTHADPPPDRPVHLTSSKADEMLKPLIEKARESLPDAKKRFLDGLPSGYKLSVTTRIRDGRGRVEQVFVLVKNWKNDTIDGELASQVALTDYKIGQPLKVAEKDMLDWTILSPQGTEEGNLIGKFLDSQH